MILSGGAETLQQELVTGKVPIKLGTGIKHHQGTAWTELYNKHIRHKGKLTFYNNISVIDLFR